MARRTKREIMSGVENVVRSRVIDHSTVEYYRTDGSRVIRLHLTDIITYNPDGSCTLNTDGRWQTVTTKDRMNKFSPVSIHQEKSIWYVRNDYVDGKTHVYADGITFYLNGTVKGEGRDPKVYLRLTKDINKYVKGYMTALVNRKIPLPSGGDCWDCCMKDKNGRSMGDLISSKDLHGNNHIISHFKEKYYVPSLLINAMEEMGSSQIAKSCVGYWMGAHETNVGSWADFVKDQLARNLRRYLKRRLGMAA